MTTNQIILLLEIHRGTPEVQEAIGTYRDDINVLYRKGLATVTGSDVDLTTEGHDLVAVIKQSVEESVI